MIRHIVAAFAVLLVSLPLSAALTLVMLPAWRWLEERYRIESVGHSGPADWCFVLVFVVCVLATGSLYVIDVARTRRRDSGIG